MVADTFSATLGLLYMGTGNDNNNWGNNHNAQVSQILEDAIAGIFFSGATSGTVDLSGTAPPAGPSQARFWQLKFSGSLAATLTVKVPNLTKEWLINNSCTLNGFGLLIQTPSGTPVQIPSGFWRAWCDGNNVINVWPEGAFNIFMPGGASAAAPSYSSLLEQNSGFYRFATQDWRITVNGTDVVRFTGPGSGAGAQLLDILSGTSLAFAGLKIDPTGIAPPGTEWPTAAIFAPTGWYLEDGSAKTRAGDAPLFSAITVLTTGNTHNNTTVDNLPIDLRNLGLEGAFVEITGASLGTTIISINSASSMTVSSSIAGTNTGAALRILPFGQGDGSTTFNVPDARGRVLAGRDNMGGTAAGRLTAATAQGILGTKLSATGGEEAHVDTQAEMPAHGHTGSGNVNDPGHTHTSDAQKNNLQNLAGGGAQTVLPTAATINSATTGITVPTLNINNTGGGAAHNNIQPTVIRNIIIKR